MGTLTIHELIWGYIGAIALLAPGIIYALKHHWPTRFLRWIKWWDDPGQFEKHSKIKQMLTELRVETRADRAHVVQFHNGDYYDNHSSIKKFTYCYEALKNGVSSQGEEYLATVVNHYKDCLVSSYIDGLEILMNEEKAVNKLRYDDLPSCLYKSRMIDDGIHMHVGVPLHGMVDGIRRIIGFILLSYNTDRAMSMCAFDALTFEGHFEDTDTHELAPRECTGICEDCRFQRYIPLFERVLASKP